MIEENPSFAVSDGATESSFASLWANLLVTLFVNSTLPPEDRLKSAVNKATRIWRRIVDSKQLPWYAEEKRKRGAFATLIGTCFAENGKWESVAVGDTCFFKVNSSGGVESFPIEDENAFGTTPPLIGSKSADFSSVAKANGKWSSGDLFLWMTDAAAHWFLHEMNTGGHPWNIVESFVDHSDFESWLCLTRSSRVIRNDDVTILMLRVE